MDTENGQVLIIEDEPTVARAMQRLLARSGFDVSLATTGEDGERMMRRNPGAFDTVLIDFSLPDINGIEVLERLRAHDPEVCCILMSGYPLDTFSAELSESQAAGFIQKPFISSDLLNLIRKVQAEEVSLRG